MLTFARYALYPGMGKINGKYEFVSADKLVKLYGVNVRDCTIIQPYQKNPVRGRVTLLRPREDGHYSLANAPETYFW